MSVRGLRDDFEAWTKGPTSTLKPRVAELYLTRLDQRVLPELGEQTRATAVTPAALRRMIERLTAAGLSGSTVRGCVNATSCMFKLAVRQGVIEINPVRGLERGDRPSGRRKREPRYIDRKQIDALLGQLGVEYQPIAAALAFAGLLFRGAGAGLGRHRLHRRHGSASHRGDEDPGKQACCAARRRPCSHAACAPLMGSRTRTRPGAAGSTVVPTSGLPHRRRNVLRAVYLAGDRAGLNPEGVPKVGLHSLRHSTAALLLASGAVAEGL